MLVLMLHRTEAGSTRARDCPMLLCFTSVAEILSDLPRARSLGRASISASSPSSNRTGLCSRTLEKASGPRSLFSLWPATGTGMPKSTSTASSKPKCRHWCAGTAPPALSGTGRTQPCPGTKPATQRCPSFQEFARHRNSATTGARCQGWESMPAAPRPRACGGSAPGSLRCRGNRGFRQGVFDRTARRRCAPA